MTEAQKNRKFKKIESLKKVLQAERKKFGGYDDSYGRRYSIAEIYYEIGEHAKTNRYLNWFNKNFPDDETYSYFQLGAAVTYYETKKIEKAVEAIVKLNSLNLYLVDLLIGIQVIDHNKDEWSESETLEYANQSLDELRKLISPTFIDWLTKIHSEENYQMWFKKLLSILKLIKGLEVSDERNSLLKAKNKCLDDWVNK